MTAMASSGLPGFGNFIGEMMILLGAWDKFRAQAVLAEFVEELRARLCQGV